jgi:hypothetical protein
LTVLVTWFIVARVGLGVDELRGVDVAAWLPAPVPFVTASLLLLAAYFLSAALWGRIVVDLGGPRLAIGDSIRLFMMANLGRYVPGKVWQIAGLAALARSRGVAPAIGTAAAVLGQGIALVAATAVGMGALSGAPAAYRTWAMVGGAVVMAAAVSAAMPPVFRRLADAWFRLARTEHPASLESVHGARWLALYGLNWVLYALSFWVLCISLGLDASPVPIASAFAASYVLGYLMIFAPAGLGPREGFLIALLTPYFGVGPSGVVAVIARLWTTAVELVPAGLFWAGWVSRTDPASSARRDLSAPTSDATGGEADPSATAIGREGGSGKGGES